MYDLRILLSTKTGKSTRAGAVTGFVGGIPIMLWQSTIGWGHPTVTEVIGESSLMIVAAGVTAFFTIAVLLVVLTVTGMLCGGIGGWIRKRVYSLQSSSSTN